MCFFPTFSQSDITFDPGSRVPDNTIHYYKFAILPKSSAATGEMLMIKLIGGAYYSYQKKIEIIYMGNREGFNGYLMQRDGDNYSNLRIEAYRETDGSVSVYFVMGNAYVHGKLFASVSGAASSNILIANPQKRTTTPTGTLVFSSKDRNGNLRVLSNGNIGIGTDLSPNPNNYKLAVNGIVGAKEVVVEIESSTWSDYVFDDGYVLMPLNEVEKFVNTNNHLPDIPTSSEVEAEGIGLGEMNAKLLKKIEELTLYVIDLQKQIDSLKADQF